MCRGKGSRTELAGCPWNGKEAEQSINTDLTESSKSPTSIAQSNKQCAVPGLSMGAVAIRARQAVVLRDSGRKIATCFLL